MVMRSFFLLPLCLFLFLLLGCNTWDGTIDIKYSKDLTWVQLEDGSWQLLHKDGVKKTETPIKAKSIVSPIERIRVKGYREAQEGASVSNGEGGLNISTGNPHPPPKPPSESEIAFGKGIWMMFGLAALCLIGGIIAIKMRNPRIGRNLLIAAFVLPVFAVVLLQMTLIPTWVWVVGFSVFSAFAAGAWFLKEGYNAKRVQVETGDDDA